MSNRTIATEAPATHARRAGVSAFTGAALMSTTVLGEVVVSAQEPNGTITNLGLFALFVGGFTIGAALLARGLLILKALHWASGEELSRSGRVGTRISVTGMLFLAAWGLAVLLTGLAAGSPAEASYLLFGIGMLVTIVGQIMLVVGLRRAGVLRLWSHAPLVGAAGAIVAVLVSVDPWHHLGLFTFFGAWMALGSHLVARARNGAAGFRPPPPRV